MYENRAATGRKRYPERRIGATRAIAPSRSRLGYIPHVAHRTTLREDRLREFIGLQN